MGNDGAFDGIPNVYISLSLPLSFFLPPPFLFLRFSSSPPRRRVSTSPSDYVLFFLSLFLACGLFIVPRTSRGDSEMPPRYYKPDFQVREAHTREDDDRGKIASAGATWFTERFHSTRESTRLRLLKTFARGLCERACCSPLLVALASCECYYIRRIDITVRRENPRCRDKTNFALAFARTTPARAGLRSPPGN